MLASSDKTDDKFKSPSNSCNNEQDNWMHRSKLDKLDKETSQLKQELLDLRNADLIESKKNLGDQMDSEKSPKSENKHLSKQTLEGSFFEFKYPKHQLLQSDKYSKEKMELEMQLDRKKKEVQEKQKKILELQDKVREVVQMEYQLEEKVKRLEASNKERDRLERELIATRSELATVNRTLELERQERRDLESKALALIKDAKRKWENAEKEKVIQLNKHIDTQTTRITELCTSNNEMSSRLQRMECELETANAELHKLRLFQLQYKESLAKTRELNRQSVQGVETKLEEIANRSHNQISELRAKLDFEVVKNTELESKLRNEQDSNHCRQSRLHVALELAQNELKDCQEQLRALQATIPVRETEIETLRKQLQERTKQLENVQISEQTFTNMREQLEMLKTENEQLKEQLEATKSDLNDTIINLEQNETLALNLEQITQDKAALQKRLQDSLDKEEEHLRKVGNLEELLKRLEQSVTKLEAENASLKKSGFTESNSNVASSENLLEKNSHLQEQVQKLEQQIETLRENVTAERQTARQTQMTLWKKEKELSDSNLDKRIALREVKTAEGKIKTLQEEKQKLLDRINNKTKEDEEKSKKLLKELDSAKTSLSEITKEATRNKLQADSAQRALTQANREMEELQSTSAALRREVDATRKQLRVYQDRIDSLNAENKRLSQSSMKNNEDKVALEVKIEKLEQEINGYELNIELLKETCTVLEEQLTDYERLTSDHETRENMLIQDKMKLQKDLETAEGKLRTLQATLNEENKLKLTAERNVEKLEAEVNDLESERNNLIAQRDQYKKLVQELTVQVESLSMKCGDLECDLSEMQRALENAKAEAIIVKEESSQHLTSLHELKEINYTLMGDLQNSIDLSQDLRCRIAEMENVLAEMRQFYQEREVKAESTRQQQAKLIDYLQLKLEESGKKKKTMCDKILGTKQKENIPPISTSMPIGYRELENQLTKERAKVKSLTDQLLAYKAMHISASAPSSPSSPEIKRPMAHVTETTNDILTKRLSPQRMGHNISHRFNVALPMRAGKCSGCGDSIQFGKRAAICSECQIMAHLKCSLSVPATCGLPGDFSKQFNRIMKDRNDSISSLGGSVQTLSIDQPDKPDTSPQNVQDNNSDISMEGWVKVPARSKSCWERNYLRLEESRLCIYDHQPSPGMSPIHCLNLNDKEGFNIVENIQEAEVIGTAKSDLPFIFRIESNSLTTCWPTSRLDIMALSQTDKKNWVKALKIVTSQCSSVKLMKNEKYQTVLRLEKHQLDINCAVDMPEGNVLLLGAEEGLFSYCGTKSRILTMIRGVKKVHQLSLHPPLDIAVMIAGDNRQLVYCSLRQLKSNSFAAECSRPAINTKAVLTGSESCHFYQLQDSFICAAFESYIILFKWIVEEDRGGFVKIREFETPKPCSCAIFTKHHLIVGCNKFFQIDLDNYYVEDFPEEDDNSVKVTLSGVARLGIFPICVLNVSCKFPTVELLLCYNEFGVFVNENGNRTRSIDLTWSHLPFAFAFRKPYLFIIHFSSIEIIKLDAEAFTLSSKTPERTLIELSSIRYLGVTNSKGIYIASVNSFLVLYKIEGSFNLPDLNGSITSLDTSAQDDESTSEFSFTSSLMEALDGQGKKVHFVDVSKD
ncbi:citron Rho-interacting kinase-like isoform X1 [Polistes fuscatus]|uniref:citron Rho-interacting kinase-like isoform X1 n=1 Tax=Polistes fuscatus TaxID=30207 RepID=UPI001CAA0A0A|nr:citron Rho-interacting kinase-like isoform X1 [Polistes fuscatus]